MAEKGPTRMKTTSVTIIIVTLHFIVTEKSNAVSNAVYL